MTISIFLSIHFSSKGVHYLPELDSLTNNGHVLVATIERLITCNTALRMEYEASYITKVEQKGQGHQDVISPLEREKKKFVDCATLNFQMRKC